MMLRRELPPSGFSRIQLGEVWEIKEEMQENQEQGVVQIKTRKYSATPIKGVMERGSFALSMARKTCVDVSSDGPEEPEPDQGRKIRGNQPGGSGACFTCCNPT